MFFKKRNVYGVFRRFRSFSKRMISEQKMLMTIIGSCRKIHYRAIHAHTAIWFSIVAKGFEKLRSVDAHIYYLVLCAGEGI